MVQIVADEKIPFLQGVLEPFAQVRYISGEQICRDDLEDADALLIRSVTHADASLLEGIPVSYIATATSGDDHIDREYCANQGIECYVARGCNAGAVEQYVSSAMLIWLDEQGRRMEDQVLGVVGAGHTGRRVIRTAEMMGMQVLVNDPPRQRMEGKGDFCELEKILQECDIITLHVPLTHSGRDLTYHLFDHHVFDGLGRKTCLINTCRGGVVDGQALKNALLMGRITDYIADVWENEPAFDRELRELTRIATPHIAGYSLEGKANATTMVVRDISRFFGWGLDNWAPHMHDPGKDFVIRMDVRGISLQKALTQIVSAAYDPRRDHQVWKKKPEEYERLRRSYKPRHEYGAWSVYLEDAGHDLVKVLSGMGFRIRENNSNHLQI